MTAGFAKGALVALLGFALLGVGLRAVVLATLNPKQLPRVAAWLKREPAWLAPRLLVGGVVSGALGLALLAWARSIARLVFERAFYGG